GPAPAVPPVANLSVGERMRVDVEGAGHGIEPVRVPRVGRGASRTALAANARAGATSVRVRNANGFSMGDTLIVGTPANHETVTITGITAANLGSVSAGGTGAAGTSFGVAGLTGASVDFTPALAKPPLSREFVVARGTGLDLAAPLKFTHAANLPFSVRGTGISFSPATAFPHSSNEPVQPLGAGLTLDSPLGRDHAIDAVVRDAAVTTA